MQSDLSLDISVNTQNAQRNVQQLENNIERLNRQFGAMRAAIGSIAVGALITRVIGLADKLQDLSDATGIANQNILAFASAVQQSGGSFESAGAGLNTFIKSIDEAIEGSVKTRQAFNQLGISIRDLEKLSEKALLEKALIGLEKISDKAKAAALGTELFGKAFKGVASTNISQNYTAAAVESQRYGESIRAVADLQGKLEKTFLKLQLSILKAIEPLVNFANQIPQDKIDKLVEGFVKLAAVGVQLYAAASAIKIFGSLIATITAGLGSFVLGIKLFKDGLTGVKLGATIASTAIESFQKTIAISIGYVDRFSRNVGQFAAAGGGITALTLLFTKLGARLPYISESFSALRAAIYSIGGGIGIAIAGFARMLPLIGGVGAAIYMLNESFKILTNNSLKDWFDRGASALEDWASSKFPKLADAINLVRNKLNVAPSAKQLQALDPRAELRKKEISDYGVINKLIEDRAGIEEKAITERIAANDANYKALLQFNIARNQELKNLQLALSLDSARISAQTNLLVKDNQILRLSEDQIEIAQALNQLDEQRIQTIEKLKLQISAIKTQSADDINAQSKILSLNKDIVAVNQLYASQAADISQKLTTLKDAQATIKILEEDRMRNLDRISINYDKQVEKTQALRSILSDVNQQISAQKFDQSIIGQSPIAQQLEKIKADSAIAARTASQTFAQSFESTDGMSAIDNIALLNGLDQIKAKYSELSAIQAENVRLNYEYSQSWLAGWNEAFLNFQQTATNSAQIAKDQFLSVTNRMGSAIDNFVETGKFKFSDLATSIIQDLIKIELKAMASKMLSPILSGFGAGIGSLFGGGGPALLNGFANGGNPPINKPSIVGERGPELFLPKTAGTIIPNNQLGGQTSTTNNYITNNIQAVDAKSVQQLFADNRRALFGTVKLAEKEMNYR